MKLLYILLPHININYNLALWYRWISCVLELHRSDRPKGRRRERKELQSFDFSMVDNGSHTYQTDETDRHLTSHSLPPSLSY